MRSPSGKATEVCREVVRKRLLSEIGTVASFADFFRVLTLFFISACQTSPICMWALEKQTITIQLLAKTKPIQLLARTKPIQLLARTKPIQLDRRRYPD
jgi:hypothetical protein